MTNTKIADQHLSRQAYVYVRQSTPGQVRFNQESTERQYNLAGKAQSLGWSPERIRTRFRCDPFVRDVAIDPGRASAPCVTVPHMLPSTEPTVSAPTMLCLSWLIPTPHMTAVYASRPPSPTAAQHSLPGGPLRPYLGRTFTGWIAPA
jgi:hypothetical protein